MQNVNQFERHRAALEQCIHNSVHDAETRNTMLAHIGQMGAAMHAEERTADAALRTHHARGHNPLRAFVLGVVEGVA